MASRTEKRGAVLGMVENYLGEETFRQGVHNYLQAHLYANATAEDFWNAQTSTAISPSTRSWQSFIAEPGVPLLAFSARCERGSGDAEPLLPFRSDSGFLTALDASGLRQDRWKAHLPCPDGERCDTAASGGCDAALLLCQCGGEGLLPYGLCSLAGQGHRREGRDGADSAGANRIVGGSAGRWFARTRPI